MGLTNTETSGKKRKSEPQIGVSTPIQDAEQAPPLPKKKMKASIKSSQPSAATTASERNHDAQSKTKRINNSAKKCPTGDESDGASVSANLAHPAKKAKVDELTALTRVQIRRSGKTILNF